MNFSDKITKIINFVVSHPETIASKTILDRSHVSGNYFETGEELALQLEDVLKKSNKNMIDIYFDLIR